jgi:hypothetical protein
MADVKQSSSDPGGKWFNRIRKFSGIVVLLMPILFSLYFLFYAVNTGFVIFNVILAFVMGLLCAGVTGIVILIVVMIGIYLFMAVLKVLLFSGWITKDTEDNIMRSLQESFEAISPD